MTAPIKKITAVITFGRNSCRRKRDETTIPNHVRALKILKLFRAPGKYDVTFALNQRGRYHVTHELSFPRVRRIGDDDMGHSFYVCFLPSAWTGKRISITIREKKERETK